MRRAVLAAVAALALLPASAGAAAPPGPWIRLPAEPAAMAAALVRADAGLRQAVDGWRGESGAVPRSQAPADVLLWALYEQRLVRRMRNDVALGDAALARLRGPLRASLRETVLAGRELAALSAGAPPPPRRRLRTGPALPPATLLRHYREAERRFGVPWHVLAAVNLVETLFGKLRSPSTAGALGPMQFLPATWRAYGLGGDVHDPRDAILGAANYLRASGAPRDLRGALFAYNHSGAYVRAVLRYAGLIGRDPDAFLTFHSWQVFARTPDGVQRLTGPGLGSS